MKIIKVPIEYILVSHDDPYYRITLTDEEYEEYSKLEDVDKQLYLEQNADLYYGYIDNMLELGSVLFEDTDIVDLNP